MLGLVRFLLVSIVFLTPVTTAQAALPLAASAAVGGAGQTAAGSLEIPPGMSDEEVLRFIGGLTDAEARLLVLQRVREMRAAERAGASGPSGLAVVMLRF
ncbi:MAG: hypothetical protein QF491_16045, partial [Alphaproteobacteria bacterium]|nr:hypothetical protein [Alphaproteobacteria bacterium]